MASHRPLPRLVELIAMWPFAAMMWLHEQNSRHTRAEEQHQPDRRAGRGRRDDHRHPTREAGGDNRLLGYFARPGEAHSQRNGSARQRQAPHTETGGETARTRSDRRRLRLRRPPLNLYLDTSALVKLLVDEPDSDLANQAYDSAPAASTSAIARLEATSALARMQKGGRLSGRVCRAALDDLDDLWRELQVHAVTDPLIETATRAATEHALRAYDSLHLATITTFGDVEEVTVACWDRELRAAARDYGFALVPERL